MALEVKRAYQSKLFQRLLTGTRPAIQPRLANSSRYAFNSLAVVDIGSIHLHCRGNSYSDVHFMEVGSNGGEEYGFGNNCDDNYYCSLWLFWAIGGDGGDGGTRISGLPLKWTLHSTLYS